MKNVNALWVATVEEIISTLDDPTQTVIGVTPNLIEMERSLVVPEFQSEADDAIRRLANEIALRGTFVEAEGVRCLNMSNAEIIEVLKRCAMPNEYVRYAKVTVTGKTGVRIRSRNDGSKVMGTARIVSNDPIAKSKLFPLESDKFLPADVVMQFIKDCDFDYILAIDMYYHTYKLVEVDEGVKHADA